ncbi:ATP-binding protein [Streptomyces sp. 351MFTsu5.1]|uniref:ATP-binding protein n=1 Tax=Streptomyces sp. 351MFTsu5.1 TaxID=1172180 RepID=UPI00035C23A3|nr:ATP-binding protein [Streptomyces sp. 351MFTsu5.1]
MSHLRAPAARADRREGGRHGRQVARPAPSLPETHIRPQLLRLAVLPPIAVALSGCAAVLFTVRTTGTRPGLVLWGVLGGALSVTLAGILIAAVAADRAAATVSDRVGALRRSSARREAELRALVEGLRRGEAPPGRAPRSGPAEGADDFELLAADLTRAHDGAVTAVVQAAQLSSQAGSEQKLEVFVNLARRLQSLVHREISILDELENEIEDPDLLKGLFHVDHLATRIRRHAENLAVLGGAVSRRQWSNPVSMTEVLRSAIAEVEQYSRVKLVPPIDGTLRGHAVADVIHLLAELVENATVFSAPHTQVLLRANLVTSGLAIEVEDRGLGMPVAEQQRMNALLTDPDQVNVASLLADGRIGLFVVSQLAKRHGIHVRLQSNIYGGVQAVLVVPQALLGSAPGVVGAQPPEGAVSGVGAPRSPGPLRPGTQARHRGAPAEPRPGDDPNRRQSQGTAGANLNGHATPTGKGGAMGTRGPDGGRTAPAEGEGDGGGRGRGGAASPRGSGRGSDGDGRGPGAGERASSDPGRGASGVAGGGEVPTGEAGRAQAGGEFVPGVGGPEPGAGGLEPGVGGPEPGAGGLEPGAGGRGSDGAGSIANGASPSGGSRTSTEGDARVSHGRGPGFGGSDPLSSGGPSLTGAAGVSARGTGPSAGGDGASASGIGPLAVGYRAGSHGNGSPADGNGVRAHGNESFVDGNGVGAREHGSSADGNGVGAHGNGRAVGEGKGGRPAPLPVRGARAGRPNPAEAVPGIRPADRRLVEEHVVAPPTPRAGTVRGTMGKPQLPRRRAQEHIVPQLRGGPAPRQDAESVAGHDPGLMAAFQRGISLAEAQQHLESDPGEPGPSVPVAPPHMAPDHMGPAHTAAALMDPFSNMPPASVESTRLPSPDPSAAFGFDVVTPIHGTPVDGTPIDVTPMERPHISDPHGLGPDHTTPRHDGSAPAG